MARKNKINIAILTGAFLCIAFALPASASYVPFNTNVNMKIGIGTSSPGSNLSVLGGMSLGSYATTAAPAGGIIASSNVGLGTFLPSQALEIGNQALDINSSGNIGIGTIIPNNSIIVATGNVGINSAFPGQKLDVTGTIRATGFTLTGQGAAINYALTATDNSGDANWQSVSGGWTQAGTNVYTTTGSNNVGIGTAAPTGKLEVEGGNVGIGTWGNLSGGTGLQVNGNVGIGTSKVGGTKEGALSVMNGNVGIGTWTPTSPLAVGSGANVFTVNNTGAITATTGITTTGGYAQTGGGINSLSGNVGIGTTTPQGALVVTNGNVGIGTWTAAGGNLIVNGGGNVGIGSAWPGQVLDVNGTVRTTGFTMSTGAPLSGYVLEASDTSGDAMWATVSTVSGWTLSGNNVYETKGGNVGIGTTLSSNGLDVATNVSIGTMYAGNVNAPPNSLIVQSNIGIGTWEPSSALTVGANAFTLSSSGAITTTGGYVQTGAGVNSLSGNVGIGTTTPQGALVVTNGNVGIGTWVPRKTLEVNGTIMADTKYNYPSGFGVLVDSSGDLYAHAALLDNSNSAGSNAYCLTSTGTGVAWVLCTSAGGSAGNPSAPANSVQFDDAGAFGGSANFVTNGTNVGIGTTLSSNSLDVAKNVSIGTTYAGYYTAPPNSLIVQANVGIGTWVPGASLEVEGGNVGISTTAPSATFTFQGSATIFSGAILGNVGSGTDVITAGGQGTLAGGNATHTANTGSIIATNTGSFAFGYSQGGAGGSSTITSTVLGAIAMGYASNNATIESTSQGSVAMGHAQVNGTIEATNEGSIAMGYAAGSLESTSSGSIAMGNVNTNEILESTGAAAVAMGYANSGNLESTGSGSIAMGYSTGTLQATLIASVAIGQNVQAINNNALAFGSSVVNANPSTFMVGFNATPTMTVTSSNVGINTVSPFAALSVVGNVGIGTNINSTYLTVTPPSGGLVVQGNVGLGTYLPSQALEIGNQKVDIESSGNVGIGTIAPTGALEIEGGNVGIGTWTVPDGGTNNTVHWGNVGIGTSKVGGTGEAALTVMNGRVGIGTWVPGGALDVEGGNVGIGTHAPGAILDLGTGATPLVIPALKSTTGTRFLCISAIGIVSSSASPCSGT